MGTGTGTGTKKASSKGAKAKAAAEAEEKAAADLARNAHPGSYGLARRTAHIHRVHRIRRLPITLSRRYETVD